METENSDRFATALSCPFTRGLTVTQGGGLLIDPDLFAQTNFICFVSVATFLVALDALICGLLFSKCSAKNLWLSSLNWALNRQYALVAKPSGKSASNSINTSAFVVTYPAVNFRVARHSGRI